MKVIKHAILGTLQPVQGPIATFLSPEDDFDLAFYTDGPVWLARLELDYYSNVTYALETIEKEFALDKEWLEKYGRGGFVAKFEELFDTVAKSQLTFIPHTKIVEIRNSILTLMEEAFVKIDNGEQP